MEMKKVLPILIAILLVGTLLPLSVSSNDSYQYKYGLPYIEPDAYHHVTTHAGVQSGTGSPPIIKCKWERPDNDTLTSGTQVLPNVGGKVTVYYYAVVTDPQGVDTVQAVYVDVWHPDKTFKYEIELNHTVTGPQAANMVQDAYDDGILVTNTSYTLSEIKDELIQYEAYLWWGSADLDYCQPAGNYTVAARAVDNYAEWSDPLWNTFWYIPVAAIQIDFTDVYYETATISTTKWVGGDYNFGTSDKPTIRNIGNTPVKINIQQDDMNFGKTGDDWNVKFDARLGSDISNAVEYWPEQTAILNGSIPLCTEEKIDFSIHIYKGVAGHDYTGSMTIWPTIYDWPPYTTPSVYVTTPPGGTPTP